MKMVQYSIRGRSIDGTVYWDGHGWSIRQYAFRFDKLFAEIQLTHLRKEQATKNIDECVGHLTLIHAPRRQYGFWRKEKRYFNQLPGVEGGRVYDAWLYGSDRAYNGKPYRNPYPPGYRHDEFKRGYNVTTPMHQSPRAPNQHG